MKTGWCFIGAGSIVRRVLAELGGRSDFQLISVYSRSRENAQAITDQYGGHAFDSVEEALRCPGVQAVYVATPHACHKHHVLAALDAGLPVLCEKPFALSLPDAAEMIAHARSKGLYLMEGMWMRHNPIIRQVLARIGNGEIGTVRYLTANFASRADGQSGRLFDRALGGGSLLDVGVYPLALAQFVFQAAPRQLHATAHMSPLGIDLSCTVQLDYGDGATASLFSSIEVDAPQDAWIYGERGTIHLPQFWAPTQAEITIGGHSETLCDPRDGEGFRYEFAAVADDLAANRLENPLLPHADTLSLAETVDRIRQQIGLHY